MRSCIEALKRVRDMQHPVVVHVNTQKGEGYVPAEEYREQFHYRKPFVLKDGNLKNDTSDVADYAKVTRDFLLAKCNEIPNLLVVTSATPESFDFMDEEREKAGKHFIDVDIAEQTGVALMSGAARGGAKVVYPIVSTFMQRAYDQLIEDWAMNNSPAVIPVLESGIKGIVDETHLGFWDIPFITSIPDIIYLAPTNVEEYLAMLEWGVRQDRHKVAIKVPTYSFEHASREVETDYSDLNKFRIVKNGSDVAVIGVGDFFPKAAKVVDILQSCGVNATLINPRFISGIDTDLLKSLEKNHKVVVTIEDGSLEGGFGQRVASALGTSAMKVLNFGLQKRFVDRYNVEELEKEYSLLPEQIVDKIKDILQ